MIHSPVPLRRSIFGLSVLTLILSACASNPPPTAVPATDAPTQTATIVVPPTVTYTPTQTFTPTPSVVMLTFTKNAFCRNGPSMLYFDKGSFNQGDVAQAEGRNDAGPRWWYMLMANGDHCWVSESTVQPNPAAEGLPVQLPEKSLPQTPPDLWADRVCKPNKGGFFVALNWTPSSTADGYYVYLNGEQIQDVTNGMQSSYIIKLPMNEPVSYAFEAYNSIGYGERITIDDPGCP